MARKMPSARSLVGRRIVAFDPGPFNDGRGGTAHNPSITLDNGVVLRFMTEETECGEYGTFIVVQKARKK